MSELKLNGKIKTICDVQTGTSASGEWKKVTFVIANNDGYEGREQIFAFEIFGAEKVEDFIKYNKVDREVEVSYNIRTSEYSGKYYTSLAAWKIFGASAGETAAQPAVQVEESDLPF
jgi:hypothetical protein